MVEQIDRDAAGDYLESRGERTLALRARNVGGKLAEAFEAHRAAERARILAALREPDAAMVVGKAVHEALSRQGVIAYLNMPNDTAEVVTTAALSAAADHMEAGDAN
jgi:hypothetical protein